MNFNSTFNNTICNDNKTLIYLINYNICIFNNLLFDKYELIRFSLFLLLIILLYFIYFIYFLEILLNKILNKEEFIIYKEESFFSILFYKIFNIIFCNTFCNNMFYCLINFICYNLLIYNLCNCFYNLSFCFHNIISNIFQIYKNNNQNYFILIKYDNSIDEMFNSFEKKFDKNFIKMNKV